MSAQAHEPLDRLLTLQDAAPLLGMRYKALVERVSRGLAPELEPVKVFGRWKVRLSMIQRIQQTGTGVRSTRALVARLHFPHLVRARRR